MNYKKQSNCIYHCCYHIVITTKYRRKIFTLPVFDFFKKKLHEVTRRYPEIEILEVNHDRDHVHILLSIPPKMSVGSVVRLIKTNTARSMKKYFHFLKKVYASTDGIWSESYFVSTTGVNEEVILRYIVMQGKEDCGQAKLEF